MHTEAVSGAYQLVKYFTSKIPVFSIHWLVVIFIYYFALSSAAAETAIVTQAPEVCTGSEVSLELASNESFHDEQDITLSSDKDGFVIHPGSHITVTAGQSIRLMPGTHIMAGAEMKASIVSLDYQESLEKERHEAAKQETMISILKRSPIEKEDVLETENMIRGYNGSGSGATFTSSFTCMVLLPVRAQDIPARIITVSHKNASPYFTKFSGLPHKYVFFTTLSWGERGESIAVMRT